MNLLVFTSKVLCEEVKGHITATPSLVMGSVRGGALYTLITLVCPGGREFLQPSLTLSSNLFSLVLFSFASGLLHSSLVYRLRNADLFHLFGVSTCKGSVVYFFSYLVLCGIGFVSVCECMCV